MAAAAAGAAEEAAAAAAAAAEEERRREGARESEGECGDEGDSDSSADGEDEEKENEAEIQRLEEQVGGGEQRVSLQPRAEPPSAGPGPGSPGRAPSAPRTEACRGRRGGGGGGLCSAAEALRRRRGQVRGAREGAPRSRPAARGAWRV